MKKVFAVFLTVLLLLSLFTACGGSSTGTVSAPMAQPSAAPYPDKEELYGSYAQNASESKETVVGQTSGAGGTGSVLTGIGAAAPASQKMIYNVTADIETIKFEETIKGVDDLMTAYGAFVENSYISGKNYADTFYGHETYRSASFTIRVPSDKLTAMTANLSTLGNVISSNTQSQNITIQYIDAESRLKACRAEETSLLAMLEKAATVEVILTVQSRLSDVRYEIESLTSSLKNWQNQVDYSTVTLSIKEVSELTEKTPPPQRTYWEEVRDGFNSTMKGIGAFFKGLFKGVVIILPVLLILAVIVVVVIIIIRVTIKKNRTNSDPDISKKE